MPAKSKKPDNLKTRCRCGYLVGVTKDFKIRSHKVCGYGIRHCKGSGTMVDRGSCARESSSIWRWQ